MSKLIVYNTYALLLVELIFNVQNNYRLIYRKVFVKASLIQSNGAKNSYALYSFQRITSNEFRHAATKKPFLQQREETASCCTFPIELTYLALQKL